MMPMLLAIVDHRYRAAGCGILNMMSTIVGVGVCCRRDEGC